MIFYKHIIPFNDFSYTPNTSTNISDLHAEEKLAVSSKSSEKKT